MSLKESEDLIGQTTLSPEVSIKELLKAVIEKRVSFRMKVRGFSMTPFIQDGDIVTVSPLNYCQNLFGQAVAFMHPQSDKLVIHRVIAKNQNSYLIKGDSAYSPDGLIRKENILGYVSKIERNGRKIHLGLGQERFIIALLSRRVLPLLVSISRKLPSSIRRILKCLISL